MLNHLSNVICFFIPKQKDEEPTGYTELSLYEIEGRARQREYDMVRRDKEERLTKAVRGGELRARKIRNLRKRMVINNKR